MEKTYKGFTVKDNGTIINKYGKEVGYNGNKGYRYVQVGDKKVLIHRFIWEAFNGGIPEGMEIDHINAVRDDNRLENLRLVTHKENCNNPLSIDTYKESNKGKITEKFSKSRKKYDLPKDRKEYLREYYKAHREEILERMRAYYKERN